MKQSIKNILPVLLVFLMISLACNFPTEETAIPTSEPDLPVSTPLQGEGESTIEQDSSTGRVTIVLTEADLTGFLAAELAAQENPPLLNPRVYLRDGQVEVLGQTQLGPLTTDVRLIMVVNVTSDGQLDFQVVSADLGSVPAPAQLTDQLSIIANDNFRRSVGPQMQGYRAERVVIDGGRITITGIPE
jgi:hypothetical protein